MNTAARTPEDFLRSIDAARAERRRLKDTERQDDGRPLDPWERYRVLSDHHDRLVDVAEHGDRKTRFALLILGSINAVNLLLATRADWTALPQAQRHLFAVYAVCYVVLSLGFFLYAIAALRPRDEEAARPDGARPLLLAADPHGETAADYDERWRQARVGDLTGELAAMVLQVARANAVKANALHRVYMGLYVLLGLTAVFAAAAGFIGLV